MKQEAPTSISRSSSPDEEITFIIKEIFPTNRVDHIERDKTWGLISCDIYIMESCPDIPDTLTLDQAEITTHDFLLTAEENFRWQQYLLAKGCDERLKDNPYMKDNVKELKTPDLQTLERKTKEKLLDAVNKANDEMLNNGRTAVFEKHLSRKEAYEDILLLIQDLEKNQEEENTNEQTKEESEEEEELELD